MIIPTVTGPAVAQKLPELLSFWCYAEDKCISLTVIETANIDSNFHLTKVRYDMNNGTEPFEEVFSTICDENLVIALEADGQVGEPVFFDNLAPVPVDQNAGYDSDYVHYLVGDFECEWAKQFDQQRTRTE